MIERRASRSGIIYGAWAALSLFALLGTLQYLHAVWTYEWNAAFRRAEVAAELTEQAVLRSAEGIAAVLDLAETRAELSDGGDGMATEALDRRFRIIVAEHRFGIRDIMAVTPGGMVEWSPLDALNGPPVANREIVELLTRDNAPRVVVAAPFINPVSGRWVLPVGRPLRDGQGRLSRMVIVGFDPMHLSWLLATIAAQEDRSLSVRQISNGQVRAASRRAEERMAEGARPDHPVVAAARLAGEGRLESTRVSNGRPLMVAFRAVPSRDLVVYAALDRDVEMAPFRRTARPVVAAVLLYVLGSLFMAVAWDRNARLRQTLHEQATLDPLTGLYNRRALEERMRNHGAQVFACLLFDLDHFKTINDRFGHARGDEVLQEVARMLRNEVRGGDIVCRWGGEEILVVLHHCPRDKALMRAEALRGAIEALYEEERRVTASCGVACFPDDGETLRAITGLADQALYRAKRDGRNRVAMVEPATTG